MGFHFAGDFRLYKRRPALLPLQERLNAVRREKSPLRVVSRLARHADLFGYLLLSQWFAPVRLVKLKYCFRPVYQPDGMLPFGSELFKLTPCNRV
jgi:hypothetical protein